MSVFSIAVSAEESSNSQTNKIQTIKQNETKVLNISSFDAFAIQGVSLSQWNEDKKKDSWKHTGRPLVELRVDGDATRMFAVSLDGKTLVSIGSSNIGVWDLDKFKLTSVRQVKGRPLSIELSPNGKLMALGYPSGNIFVYQVSDGRKLSTLKGAKGLTAMTISPDGTKIAASDKENIVHVWDTQTGRSISASEELSRINALAFSHDGKMLASAGTSLIDDQNTIQIWGGSEYFLLASLAGHNEEVNALSFSRDNKMLYSASQDNTVRRWDVKIGNAVLEIASHQDDVVKVISSADNSWVFTASLDGTINIWLEQEGQITQIKSMKVPLLQAGSLRFIPKRNWLAGIADVNKGISIWSASSYSYHPWRDIRQLVEHEFLNKRYTPKEGVPLIKKPQLPPLSSFEKDPFESQATYVKRLSIRYKKQVNALLEDYRRKIELRNSKVIKLRDQLSRTTSLQAVEQRILATEAVKQMLGKTLVYPLELNGKPGYDPEREIMGVRIGFSRAYYFETFEVRVKEGAPARQLYEALKAGEVVADVDFAFINVSRVRAVRVRLKIGDKVYEGNARPTKGFKVITDSIRNIKKPNNPYEFQRYKIPYRNFDEFIENSLSKAK